MHDSVERFTADVGLSNRQANVHPPGHQLVHLWCVVFMCLPRRQLLRLRFGRGDDVRLKVAQQIAEVGVLVRFQDPMVLLGKVHEHAPRLLRTRDDGLHRHGQIRDDGLQLLRDAPRVGDVGDDEASQMGQCADRFCQVAAGGLVEVEYDRQVVACSECVSQRVENDFPLSCETP